MSEQKDSDFDTEEDYHHEYDGVIDELEGDLCHARIYSPKTNEVIYFITFYKDKFPEDEREKIQEHIIFVLSCGCKDGKSYNSFKLKKFIPETQEQRAKRLKEVEEIIEYLEECNRKSDIERAKSNN